MARPIRYQMERVQGGPELDQLQGSLERALEDISKDYAPQVPSEELSYTVADEAVWAGTPPSNLWEAVHRIARHVANAATGPIEELP